MATIVDYRDQAIAGMIAPQTGEALIRESWQSIARYTGLASLARSLQKSVILAPLGWLVLAPLFSLRFLAIVPGLGFLATRYRLTNRRLMICHGFRPRPIREVPLAEIANVQIDFDANTEFYRAANLRVLDRAGTVVLELPGCKAPESFRGAILQAVDAWGQPAAASTSSTRSE